MSSIKPMLSIKASLVKQLTLLISLILFFVLLFLDISVDTYVEKQFENTLVQEGKRLVNLVKVERGRISLSAHADLKQEFDPQQQAKYFQIWVDDQVIEKSASLEAFPDFTMPNIKLMSNEYLIKSITLPDGKSGRLFIYNVGNAQKYNAAYQGDIYLGLARVSESLENILVLIDIVFLLTAIGTAFFVRHLVNKIVTRGLQPIDLLNKQIREMNVNDEHTHFAITAPPEEINTIIDELNQFLKENRTLLQSEQRLTSDIAHELKTPISELMSVTEIAIKFPDNEEVLATFKDDVIAISRRMHNIVNSLLMFNKANSKQFKVSTTKVDLTAQLTAFINRTYTISKANEGRIMLSCPQGVMINSDLFCLDSILTNLINNALFYSPANTPVAIKVEENHEQISLTVTNQLTLAVSDNDLLNMFEPLWQKDTARTSENHFGLGLSIVQRLCEQIGARISVQLTAKNTIEFMLIFSR